MTNTKSINLTLILAGAVLFLLGYNLIGAWSGPSSPPPGNNVAAPINVGPLKQTKTGDLEVRNSIANIHVATNQTRSNLYCDALGNNCITQADIIQYGGSYVSKGFCIYSKGRVQRCSMSITVAQCESQNILGQVQDCSPCATPNTITGSCSCPVGFTAQSLGEFSTANCQADEDSDPICRPSAPKEVFTCFKT